VILLRDTIRRLVTRTPKRPKPSGKPPVVIAAAPARRRCRPLLAAKRKAARTAVSPAHSQPLQDGRHLAGLLAPGLQAFLYASSFDLCRATRRACGGRAGARQNNEQVRAQVGEKNPHAGQSPVSNIHQLALGTTNCL
jgi:hypothetical protein